jgi:basic amino acid/polyamine antiporter, APA family
MDTAEPSAADVSTTAQSGLFARRATGLVREVSPISAAIYNASCASPGLYIAVSVFIAYATFPQANIILSLLILVPIALLVAVTMSALQRTIPRSGGDYVIVSRLFTPSLGVASTLLIMVAAITGAGFYAYSFVSVGLQPMLAIIGTITHSHGLLSTASTLTDKTWVTIFALVFAAFGVALVSGPLRVTMRLQNICIAIATIGFVLGLIVFWFTSKGGFIHSYNSYAGTGAYQRLTVEGGVAHYSARDTVFATGAITAAMIYQWWSVYFAGEIKQVSRRSYFTMIAPTLVFSGAFALMIGTMLLKFDHGFLVAANTGAKGYNLATGPSWTFLAAIASGSPVVAVILAVTFVFWMPPLMILQLVPPIRQFFAMAFDGLLPEAVTKVGSRTRIPWVSVLVVAVLTFGATVWAVSGRSFFQALIYGPLFANISMLTLSLGAILLPWRHPELWSGGPLSGRFLGVPVLTLLGVATFIAVAFTTVVLLQPEYGVSVGRFVFWAVLIAVVGFALYFGALYVQRRNGRDIALNYREIPPE